MFLLNLNSFSYYNLLNYSSLKSIMKPPQRKEYNIKNNNHNHNQSKSNTNGNGNGNGNANSNTTTIMNNNRKSSMKNIDQ